MTDHPDTYVLENIGEEWRLIVFGHEDVPYQSKTVSSVKNIHQSAFLGKLLKGVDMRAVKFASSVTKENIPFSFFNIFQHAKKKERLEQIEEITQINCQILKQIALLSTQVQNNMDEITKLQNQKEC